MLEVLQNLLWILVLLACLGFGLFIFVFTIFVLFSKK